MFKYIKYKKHILFATSVMQEDGAQISSIVK